MKNIYHSHEDAQHGWLAVKRVELIRLGIIDKISRHSYQRGKTVYLEGDCDVNIFVNRKREMHEAFKIVGSYQQYSRIRSYERFTV